MPPMITVVRVRLQPGAISRLNLLSHENQLKMMLLPL